MKEKRVKANNLEPYEDKKSNYEGEQLKSTQMTKPRSINKNGIQFLESKSDYTHSYLSPRAS